LGCKASEVSKAQQVPLEEKVHQVMRDNKAQEATRVLQVAWAVWVHMANMVQTESLVWMGTKANVVILDPAACVVWAEHPVRKVTRVRRALRDTTVLVECRAQGVRKVLKA
jgi:hypothetical protein